MEELHIIAKFSAKIRTFTLVTSIAFAANVKEGCFQFGLLPFYFTMGHDKSIASLDKDLIRCF